MREQGNGITFDTTLSGDRLPVLSHYSQARSVEHTFIISSDHLDSIFEFRHFFWHTYYSTAQVCQEDSDQNHDLWLRRNYRMVRSCNRQVPSYQRHRHKKFLPDDNGSRYK